MRRSRAVHAAATGSLPFSGWRLALVAVLAGAFSALSLPPLYIVPALAAGLLFLSRCADDAATWRQAAWCGFWFGWGFHTAGLYWLTDAILTRVHDYWWAVPIAAPGCALILAPFAAFPTAICRLVPPGWRRALLFAASWTAADMGRIYLFTGFPWNPVGSILEWPGRPGDWMIQPAAIIGVDGLTFVIVLSALLVWQGRAARIACAAFWVLWASWGAYRQAHLPVLAVTNPVVALAQGNVSEAEILTQADAVASFRRYLRLTAQGVAEARRIAPDRAPVYIWPESGFPGLLDEEEPARRLMAEAGEGAWGVVGSDRRDGRGHWFNSAMALNEVGQIVTIYDKSTLVPFGEYQPRFIPFNLLPGQLTPGPGLVTWQQAGLGKVGPMVCYEIIFSGHVVASPRPFWLLNITNDAWFGNSAGPRQHLATLRMRAVEEGLPAVQAANTGISAVYDAFGHENARLGWGMSGVLVAPVPSPLPETIFGHYGRGLAIVMCALGATVAFASRLRL